MHMHVGRPAVAHRSSFHILNVRQTTVWKPWNIDIQRGSTVTNFFLIFFFFSYLVAVSVGLARDGRGRRCRSRTSFSSVEGRKRAQQRKREKKRDTSCQQVEPVFLGWGGGMVGGGSGEKTRKINPSTIIQTEQKGAEEESVEMCVAVARLPIDR